MVGGVHRLTGGLRNPCARTHFSGRRFGTSLTGIRDKRGKSSNGPSLGIIQKCEPHERNPCAPGSRTGNLKAKEWGPQTAWDLARNIYKQKNRDRTTFFFSCGSKGTHIQKLPKECMFFVVSGGSMHRLSKMTQMKWILCEDSESPQRK